MISATGIGSGLDIDGLVSQLVSAERAGSDLQLNREGSRINVELSAFSALKSSLSSFQSSLSNLNTLSNFSKKSVSTSDPETVSVTATSSAINSSYSLVVTQLAEKHALATSGVSDKDTTALGTGEITFRFGTTDYDSGTDTYNSFTLNPESTTATLTIDSSNNTLEGIMAAINEADIGVSASIVNDGSGYRLLMASEKTGLENSLEISVSDDDGNDTDLSGLSMFAFNSGATHVEQTRAANDAQFSVNGIDVSASENIVKDVIPDATLTLKKVSADPVSIEISDDSQAITNAVDSFLVGYNKFKTTVNSLTSYNAEKNVAGTLQGDFTVRAIVNQVDNILRNSIEGLGGDFTSMAELGISTGESGNLELDKSKFAEVLASNKDDVIGIFSAIGVPDDPDIQFSKSGDLTAVGDYAINITQLASSGELAGSGVLPDFGGGGSVVIDTDNDDFSAEVDGIETGPLSITAGTYTSGEDLATEIQTRINGAKALKDAGKTVTVSYDSGASRFVLTSDSVGNSSTVNILSVDTNSATSLGLDVATGTAGVDVMGTIGGQAATGAGNLLVADEGTDAEGLNILVNGSTTGSRGSVAFTRGLASQINLYLDMLLDQDEGSIETRIDTLESRKSSLEKRREDLEAKWEAVEERYLRQFNALDTLMASLQSTSSYLETQLAALPEPNSVNR